MPRTKYEYRHKNRVQPQHAIWKPCTEDNKKLLESKWPNRYEFRLRAKGTAPKGAIVEVEE